MIVGSLLLILVAVGLLVAGVLTGSNVLIIGSIATTVIAAVVLIIGVRDSAAEDDERYDIDGDDEQESLPGRSGPGRIPSQARNRSDADPPRGNGLGDRGGAVAFGAGESVTVIDEDPPGEPSAQITSPSNAARIAALSAGVVVIDGRPRYHLSGCVHLLGRDSEPLPVAEAVELGFTPCGLCEPDSVLLAEARQV